MKKIVILDGHLLNPGDFSWESFHLLGKCKIYKRTTKKQIHERCKDADIVLVNKVVVSKEEIDRLPKLKYIGVTATGYNNIDLQAASNKGIVVANVPDYSTPSVVQHTLALLLELTNQVGVHNRAVQEGEWEKAPDFAFWKTPLIELQGLTLGIIGYGTTGRAVARFASLFGMKLIVHTRSQKEPNVDYVDLKTLMQKSDIVSLHVPHTRKTHHIIDEKSLAWMKPSAILINVSRGQLVDENALAAVLKKKRIFAAALDVLEQEPPVQSPLIGLKNCIITPHIAWATMNARKRLFSTVVENVKAFLAGEPKNVV